MLAFLVALLLGVSTLAPAGARPAAAPAGAMHHGGGCHDEATMAGCIGCGLALPAQPCPAPPSPAGARVAPSPRPVAAMTATPPELADPPPRIRA